MAIRCDWLTPVKIVGANQKPRSGRWHGGDQRCVARRLARRRVPPVGAGNPVGSAQQRGVDVAEEGYVGHRQRAEGFAMVATGEAEEVGLLRSPAVLPEVEAHLQGDFHRRSAIRGVEAMAEHMAGQRRELFRQLHHRHVGKASQHDVVELFELVAQCGVDARVRVAEQVHPPGADGVEDTSTIKILEPDALSAADGHQRNGFVELHLRARMPHGGATALQ